MFIVKRLLLALHYGFVYFNQPCDGLIEDVLAVPELDISQEELVDIFRDHPVFEVLQQVLHLYQSRHQVLSEVDPQQAGLLPDEQRLVKVFGGESLHALGPPLERHLFVAGDQAHHLLVLPDHLEWEAKGENKKKINEM